MTTTPLKAIIIDDEPNAVAVLEILLKTYCPNVLVIAATTKSTEGVKLIRQTLPDIVFLDLQMPQLNGFQVLDLLDDLQFGVIFTTAHDEKAVKAFKYSAVDFLLKPIDTDELVQAVAKFSGKKPQSGQLVLLQQSIQSINMPERLALPGVDHLSFQAVADIVYCEADNDYTNFVMANEKPMLVAKPLDDYEAIFSERNFFRINKQYLVNTKRIKALLEIDGGLIKMDNGAELQVAQHRKKGLMDFLRV